MKIIVLNGSPKGKYSVTYQYARYLQKKSSGEVEFEFFHIGRDIDKYERNGELLQEVFDEIEKSDFVLWSYPVYTFSVPYQLMRFIDLIHINRKNYIFSGKFTSQLSTSKHFYDHTAYNYLLKISEELNMKSVHGHLADMEDLKSNIGRERLIGFMKEIEYSVKENVFMPKKYLKKNDNVTKIEKLKVFNEKKVKAHKISIIIDSSKEEDNVYKMVTALKKRLPNEVNVFNLNEFSMKKGCLGCMHCAISGECVIKDDHDKLMNEAIKDSDCIIYGGTIQRHWLKSIWKKFHDRQFSNGHRVSTKGKVIAYLISGNLRNECNLREVLEARSEVGGYYLSGIVTDENSDSRIAEDIERLSKNIMFALDNNLQRPQNFYGVGGMKVFRDLVYEMRGFMREDHDFYKKNKLYDFPHKKRGMIMQSYMLGALMKIPAIRKKAMPKMKESMVAAYEKIIDEK